MAGSVMNEETLLKTLAIEIVEAGKERVVARMPVTPRVHQPFGDLCFSIQVPSLFSSSLGIGRYPGRMSYSVGISVDP